MEFVDSFKSIRKEIEELVEANTGVKYFPSESRRNKRARLYFLELRKLKRKIEHRRQEAKFDALEYSRRIDHWAKELTIFIENTIDEVTVNSLERISKDGI